MLSSSASSTTCTLLVGSLIIALIALYRAALPKPIPGIPYDAASSRRLLGNVPAMLAHMSKSEGTFITYLTDLMDSLGSPIIQVFIRPFSRPLVILADFRESHDLMTRRKEFDRSQVVGDLFLGVAPNHHIRQKTNDAWKAQRRLIQDLMTPTFLHDVAAPAILKKVNLLMDLWRLKTRAARGRPWLAAADLNHMALDAISAFAFGAGFEHSAVKPDLDAVREQGHHVPSSIDEPMVFAKGQKDPLLQSILDLTHTIGEVQGHPAPRLMWAYVMRKPKVKRAAKAKDECLKRELSDAVQRFQSGDAKSKDLRSAVDQIILKERELAQIGGRAPDYYSGVLIDELFGFIFAGHETTSTTLCWGLKYLADNQQAQSSLREALWVHFVAAKAQGRSPSIGEITSSRIPYLEATMEEILRCAGAASFVDREVIVNTRILGYDIPKGTSVTSLTTGASMMRPALQVDESRRSATSQVSKKEGRHREWDASDISRFKPERWLVASGENGTTAFDATAGPQLAFGLGTRACYGKRLAYVEIKIFLTIMIWNFELLECPPALSGYQSNLNMTHEPKSCYVRLREVDSLGNRS
ncbi:Cytochrome-P450 monooxygenase [Teratosphaeria destructans]|uniref:Cytochrome-P450 monooxygenase n=1 Tax=Teratosphaeria destructans TaxID=418781 RepID=A0A9W7T081_9PEZI|nr:Cytochrome-P450 monooxygenase [Teratosphaeria destructans]